MGVESRLSPSLDQAENGHSRANLGAEIFEYPNPAGRTVGIRSESRLHFTDLSRDLLLRCHFIDAWVIPIGQPCPPSSKKLHLEALLLAKDSIQQRLQPMKGPQAFRLSVY